MNDTMCHSCNTELKEVKQLKLLILQGQMHVQCPVCNYLHKVCFDAKGRLVIL